MAPADRDALLSAEPTGLTVREMLLRLDARQDRYEHATERRLRALEDDQLVSRTERKTIMTVFGSLRSTILAAAALGPVMAGVIAYLAK